MVMMGVTLIFAVFFAIRNHTNNPDALQMNTIKPHIYLQTYEYKLQ